MRRIAIKDDPDPKNWVSDSLLIDLTTTGIPGVGNGQPITAAPSIALDAEGNRWVFFGTGRFFVRSDAENSDQQSYYGIMEPRDGAGWKWDEVKRSDLLDVSNAIVYEDGTDVQNVPGVTNWDQLLAAIGKGWVLDFPDERERNLGQATLFGDILTFTTYVPSLNPCEFEGFTFLYATYFATGTAYEKSVIGLGTKVCAGKSEVLRRASLGRGLSITPNIHTGREAGARTYIQTSTGAIKTLLQDNPGITKSGRVSWKEDD